jgi:hypothetical protein
MKNRDKDASLILKFKAFVKNIFSSFCLKMKKLCLLNTTFIKITPFGVGLLQLDPDYFFRYSTSFTSLTVRGTSGKAAATRFGA